MNKIILSLILSLVFAISALAQGGFYGTVTCNGLGCNDFQYDQVIVEMQDGNGLIDTSYLNTFNYYNVCCIKSSSNPDVALVGYYQGNVIFFRHVFVVDEINQREDIGFVYLP